MTNKTIVQGVRTGFVAAIFSVGVLCGSMIQQSANADLASMGADMLKSASGSGGMLGSVAELGTTITDMEKNVTGLQKNIDALKKVQEALGMN